MELSEVQQLKNEIEKEILEKLINFKEKTGLNVESVDLKTILVNNGKYATRELTGLYIIVEIPHNIHTIQGKIADF